MDYGVTSLVKYSLKNTIPRQEWGAEIVPPIPHGKIVQPISLTASSHTMTSDKWNKTNTIGFHTIFIYFCTNDIGDFHSIYVRQQTGICLGWHTIIKKSPMDNNPMRPRL